MVSLRFLRDDSLLHDVTFSFSDGQVRGAHRCVLAYQSPVFRAMFDVNSPLRAARRIPLADKSSSEFDLLLEYCYSCDAKLVNSQTAAQLLMLAEEYQVLKLKKECEEWLIANVDPSTCVDCLLYAQQYRCDALEAASKTMLVKEFDAVALTESLARLPALLLAEALSQDSLFVSSEEAVFQAVTRWLEEQPGPPDAETAASLLSQVRFHTMDLASLRAVVVDHPVLALAGRVAATVRALASPSPRKQKTGGGAAGKRKATPRLTRGSAAKTARHTARLDGEEGAPSPRMAAAELGGRVLRFEEGPCTPSPVKRNAATRRATAALETSGCGRGGGKCGGDGSTDSGSAVSAAVASAGTSSSAGDARAVAGQARASSSDAAAAVGLPTPCEKAGEASSAMLEEGGGGGSTHHEEEAVLQARSSLALETRPPRKRVELLSRGNGKVFPFYTRPAELPAGSTASAARYTQPLVAAINNIAHHIAAIGGEVGGAFPLAPLLPAAAPFQPGNPFAQYLPGAPFGPPAALPGTPGAAFGGNLSASSSGVSGIGAIAGGSKEAIKDPVPATGLFQWIGSEGGQQPWKNPAVEGEVRIKRLENIFGNWIDLETQAVGESSPLLDSSFRVQSWRLGPLRPPGTLRRFYHQLQIDLGETRTFLLTHYGAMIEPRNKRGEHELCRWSLAGSNDGEEWVELHAGAWCLQQDPFYSSPVSGVCTAHRYFRFKTLGSAAAGAGFEWWERLLFTRVEFYGTLFCSSTHKRSLRRRKE